jgi:hypothetical protein
MFFFQVKFFKGEIENYSLNLRPMLPIKSCYSKSKLFDDVLKNLFSLLFTALACPEGESDFTSKAFFPFSRAPVT